jgi:tRNA threonylcarbamoyladenosine biosynthesis protein TsaB
MRFLGVDTSSSRASVALTESGRLIAEESYSAESKGSPGRTRRGNDHSEVLLSLIDSVLRTAALTLQDLTGFAVAIGPGSFTGLRIGLSTVKGLSYGSGCPVVGVSTLHACAFRPTDFSGTVCAILDARKNELYGALFRNRGGFVERISPDEIMSFQQLLERIRPLISVEPVLFAGDGVKKYGQQLLEALGKQVFLDENGNPPTTATAVALLGETAVNHGQGAFHTSLTPHYLRLAEAEANAGKLA